MNTVVDTQGMLVHVGAISFRFEADCAGGVAVFDPGGSRIRLRLITWGEKCGIARFARFGPDFVERQFLGACAGSVPDPGCHEAVAALALWLHASGTIPLAFDPVLLAHASLDLCRALATEPAAIAERPAPEIEALWHALGQAGPTRQTRPDDDDVTRIIVLPDDERADAQAAPTGKPATAQPASPDSVTLLPHEAAPASSAPAGPVRQFKRDRPPQRFVMRYGTQQPPAAPAPDHAGAAEANTAFEATPPKPRQQRPDPLAHIVPPLAASPALPLSPTGSNDNPPFAPGGAVEARTVHQPSNIRPAAAPDAVGVGMTDDPSWTPASDTFWPVRSSLARDVQRPAPAAAASRPAFELDAGVARVVAAVTRSVATAPPMDPGSMSGLLIDSFAERLEDAAADLGIALAD